MGSCPRHSFRRWPGRVAAGRQAVLSMTASYICAICAIRGALPSRGYFVEMMTVFSNASPMLSDATDSISATAR